MSIERLPLDLNIIADIVSLLPPNEQVRVSRVSKQFLEASNLAIVLQHEDYLRHSTMLINQAHKQVTTSLLRLRHIDSPSSSIVLLWTPPSNRCASICPCLAARFVTCLCAWLITASLLD